MMQGWKFTSEFPDEVNHKDRLKDIYLMTDSDYRGRITVPVLFDKKQGIIVNNESAEIIRMLNSEFNEFAKNSKLDLYPTDLRKSINEVNSWVYPNINDGV